MHLSSLKVNSIGSSIVTMWQRSRLLTYWSIAAMVVDLPRAGDARQDDDALVVAGDLAQDRRQPEPLEVGDRGIDAAGDQAEPAALLEQVDAEPGLVAVGLEDDVGEVDAAGVLEDVLLPGDKSGNISRSMSAVVSGGSCICRSTPASRMAGAIPTFRCRSEPLNLMTIRKSLLASGSLGIASTGVSTAVAMGWTPAGTVGYEVRRGSIHGTGRFATGIAPAVGRRGRRRRGPAGPATRRTGTPRLARYSLVSGSNTAP